MSNQFRNDVNENKIVEQFLDTNVYPNLFANFKHCYRKQEQLDGIDVIIKDESLNGIEFYIDEKSQTKYKNANLPTQSLELSFLARHDNQTVFKGWFLNNDLKTDYYAIIAFPKTNSGYFYQIDNIDEAEMLIIDKKRLQAQIFNRISEYEIEKISQEMRDGVLPNDYRHNGIKFKLSDHLTEQPINIIYPKAKMPIVAKLRWDKENGLQRLPVKQSTNNLNEYSKENHHQKYKHSKIRLN